MLKEQKNLQTCFNTKMDLHFGKTTAEKEGLYLDFKELKLQYQEYEKWNPMHKHLKEFEKGYEESYV